MHTLPLLPALLLLLSSSALAAPPSAFKNTLSTLHARSAAISPGDPPPTPHDKNSLSNPKKPKGKPPKRKTNQTPGTKTHSPKGKGNPKKPHKSNTIPSLPKFTPPPMLCPRNAQGCGDIVPIPTKRSLLDLHGEEFYARSPVPSSGTGKSSGKGKGKQGRKGGSKSGGLGKFSMLPKPSRFSSVCARDPEGCMAVNGVYRRALMQMEVEGEGEGVFGREAEVGMWEGEEGIYAREAWDGVEGGFELEMRGLPVYQGEAVVEAREAEWEGLEARETNPEVFWDEEY